MMAGGYRGRFAPSPTGPLHFGSLLAAVGSYLDARAHSGEWLLRIENIDPPREIPDAAERILATLRAHGLQWDSKVLYQSTRMHAYAEAVQQLEQAGFAFRCTCSRTTLDSLQGRHSPRCPVNGGKNPEADHAIRIPERDLPRGVDDLCMGRIDWGETDRSGSFVIKRRDGLIAYHLAVVVDDAYQGITHVIRGRDLLDSTACHLLLQRLLGLQSPRYGHLPLIIGEDGSKLSKQNLAQPVEDGEARSNLLACLRALGQIEPPPPYRGSCAAMLDWSAERWDRGRLPLLDVPSSSLGRTDGRPDGSNGATA